MGASESKPTTNGTNQEDERKQESGGSSTGLLKAAAAVAAIASVGVAAYNMSQTNFKTEENDQNHAMKMTSSYLPNSSQSPGYESRHVSYPIHRALTSPGRYKMQTDGSCQPNHVYGYVRTTPDDGVKRGPSGFGGILRDDRGRWVRGFIGFIGISDCLTSEIHGIYNGLLLLDRLALNGSVLESDSEAAIELIKQGSYNSKSKVIIDCWDIIIKCRRLVAENQIMISSCSRNANKCADKLANMAVEKQMEYMEYEDVPYEIKEIVDRESSNLLWQN